MGGRSLPFAPLSEGGSSSRTKFHPRRNTQEQKDTPGAGQRTRAPGQRTKPCWGIGRARSLVFAGICWFMLVCWNSGSTTRTPFSALEAPGKRRSEAAVSAPALKERRAAYHAPICPYAMAPWRHDAMTWARGRAYADSRGTPSSAPEAPGKRRTEAAAYCADAGATPGRPACANAPWTRGHTATPINPHHIDLASPQAGPNRRLPHWGMQKPARSPTANEHTQ